MRRYECTLAFAKPAPGLSCIVPQDVVLHPLTIMGVFYRLCVDLAGPFPQSEYGNYYIMVMIEHFSKWVEVVAIPSKESCETATVFRQYVLCRYGALAEVLTDQGTEFIGEFHEMRHSSITVGHRGITRRRTVKANAECRLRMSHCGRRA